MDAIAAISNVYSCFEKAWLLADENFNGIAQAVTNTAVLFTSRAYVHGEIDRHSFENNKALVHEVN